MGLLERVVKTLVWPLLHMVYFLSGLVPRDRRLWACGSFIGRRVGDNPKWFFLHVARTQPEGVRVVWVTRNEAVLDALRADGLPAVSSRSLRGVWIQLRAAVYVVEQNLWDVGYWFSRRAKELNVWHGIPLKRINHSLADPRHALFRAHRGTRWQKATTAYTHPWARRKAWRMVGTSEYVAGLMSEAFEIPPEHVVRTGLPRNDVLVGSDVEPLAPERGMVERVVRWRRDGRRVLFYMPTYRDSKLRTKHTFPVKWPELDAFLDRHDGELLVKIHPTDDASLPRGKELRRVHVLDRYADPYPLLRHTDVLVSDYSSVLFDFLLLDRPIVFFPYDLKEYQAKDRTFYDPYESVACGPVARTFDGLLGALEQVLAQGGSADRYADDRARVRAKYHTHADGLSARRLVEEVRRLLA